MITIKGENVRTATNTHNLLHVCGKSWNVGPQNARIFLFFTLFTAVVFYPCVSALCISVSDKF